MEIIKVLFSWKSSEVARLWGGLCATPNWRPFILSQTTGPAIQCKDFWFSLPCSVENTGSPQWCWGASRAALCDAQRTCGTRDCSESFRVPCFKAYWLIHCAISLAPAKNVSGFPKPNYNLLICAKSLIFQSSFMQNPTKGKDCSSHFIEKSVWEVKQLLRLSQAVIRRKMHSSTCFLFNLLALNPDLSPFKFLERAREIV